MKCIADNIIHFNLKERNYRSFIHATAAKTFNEKTWTKAEGANLTRVFVMLADSFAAGAQLHSHQTVKNNTFCSLDL